MKRDIPTIELPLAFKDETWDGFTWSIVSTDSTEFDATLTSAKFQIKDTTGAKVLNLSSAVAAEITINNAAARQWSVTIEQRLMTLEAGVYSWAFETTDADGVVKTRMIGTLIVNADTTLA